MPANSSGFLSTSCIGEVAVNGFATLLNVTYTARSRCAFIFARYTNERADQNYPSASFYILILSAFTLSSLSMVNDQIIQTNLQKPQCLPSSQRGTLDDAFSGSSPHKETATPLHTCQMFLLGGDEGFFKYLPAIVCQHC